MAGVEDAVADVDLEAEVVMASEVEMTAVEAETIAVAAVLGQATPVPGTGSATLLSAGTQTSAGGMNVTSARHPSQKEQVAAVLGQATPGPETGSATLLSAGTQTS